MDRKPNSGALRIDASHFTLGTSRACIDKLIAKIAEVDAKRG
ncbi:MAG: hypothetical protein WBA68_05495 [Alteraurantiacibacter sp.]